MWPSLLSETPKASVKSTQTTGDRKSIWAPAQSVPRKWNRNGTVAESCGSKASSLLPAYAAM